MFATNPITPIRFLGGLFAVALLIESARRYRRRDITRLSMLLTWLVSTGIIVLAIDPSLFNPLFSTFDFKRGNQRQLIAAVLFGVLALFALLVRNMAATDTNTRTIRILIESIALQAFDWSKAEDLLPGDRLIVVMPAHNEAENIGSVLAAMPAVVEGLPVSTLVVDDASEDSTSEVAQKEGAMVARLPIRRGQGMALRVGYEIALRLGATVLASLDADGQHDPNELPLVVGPVLRGEADMVVGSRVLGEYEKESHMRHLGVFVLSGLVSMLYGQRMTDVSSGFRATAAKTVRRLELEQDQYSSEVLVEALRHKTRVKEVPITMRARASGISKKPSSLRYGWRFTKVMLQTWLR
ncbi:MAG: DUF2304 family protein [Actinobacteria bacterium]|nr:MAG: DUF2304 family protein [Actinomycetota bacterium]